MKPDEVVGLLGSLLSGVADAIPGHWGLAARGLGAALTLVQGLLAQGLDPLAEITAMRSCAPELAAANQQLQDYLDHRTSRSAEPGQSTTLSIHGLQQAFLEAALLTASLQEIALDPSIVVQQIVATLPTQKPQDRLQALLRAK